MKIGLQLYTLRSIINQDLAHTLKQVKEMGFEGVELAGFYGLDAKELKEILNHSGLEVFSTHEGMTRLEGNIKQVIADYQILDTKHIIIPYAELKDELSYQENMPKIKRIVKELIASGFTVHYHNHANEFNLINGTYILDHLLNDIPELKLELDLYWALSVDVDLISYLTKHQQKIHFLHAKDMTILNGEKAFDSVGSGIIPFEEVYQISKEYWIVENDRPVGDPMENIKKSINYIVSMKEKLT